MKLNINQFYGFLLLMLLTMMLEGCSGCSHRSRKARERHRDRVERNEGRRERHRDRDSDSDLKGGQSLYSEEYIENLADSEDYDAMLDCEMGKINELKRLKDDYFRGNLPDKEVKRRMQDIEDKYAPIDKALQKADDDGSLTYNQHKQQMKLLKEYLKLAKSVANRLDSDIESIFR